MKFQVELLNCLPYIDKKSNQPKTRLAYRCIDTKYKQSTDKFVGYPELSVYLDTHNLFNSLKEKSEYFGVAVELEFVEQPSKTNPLKSDLKLKSIIVGNDVISVL